MDRQWESESIWSRLAASLPSAQVAAGEEPQEVVRRERKATGRARRVVLDSVAIVAWAYGLLKVFVFDVDRWLLERMHPSLEGWAGLRGFGVLLALAIISIFFWRWSTLGVISYVGFFPLVVLFWKIPRLIIRQRNGLVLLSIGNLMAVSLRNLRYWLATKSLAFCSLLVILLRSPRPLVALAAMFLLVALFTSAWRTMARSFERSWFVTAQQAAVDRLVNAKSVSKWTSLPEATRNQQTLTRAEATEVATNLSLALLLNRALYFWAYQLHRYRQAQVHVAFAVSSYVWLLLGAWVAFWGANQALYQLYPTEYSATGPVTPLAMLLYAAMTLVWNDGGGVASAGDLAHLLRILAMIFSFVFAGGAALNAILIWRRRRDEESLGEAVREVRRRADELEFRVRADFEVGVEEARARLEQLGQGLHWLVGWLTSTVPRDFLDPEAREVDG